LHLGAEQRYQVPPLELASALALFVQRAQALDADFVLTTENQPILSEICQRLDCLPLAVELIAARLDLFAPQTLLARLRDRRLDLLAGGALDLPARQRTLRNAIHRSYDLLNAEEARLFRRLGVFVGGFDQEALTHCGGDERTLQSLINKSLVQVAARGDEARRFLLLETIREYAWEQLRAHNELAGVQHLHAGCFVRLAEDAASHLRGPDQARWLERLAGEHANLRAALAWALNSRQTQIGARLGIALWRFWYIRGYYDEGWAWLEELLAQTEEPQSRAHLLYGQGMLARRRGDYTTAADKFTGGLVLFRELGDPRGLASALRGLAFIRYRQDDYGGARPLLDEALHLFRMLDDSEGIAVTLDNLAYIAGDSEEERRLHQESLVLRRRSGNLHGITTSLAGLAYTAMDQGDSATARVYLQEHLQINQTLGNKNGIAASLLILGELTLSEGDYTGAELLLEESLKLVHETGDRSLLPGVMEKMGATALARGEYKRAYERFEQALTLHLAAGTPYGIGLALSYFACLASAQGEAQRALTLLGAVAAVCESLRIRYRPPEQGRFAQAESTARQQLGEGAAAAAWAAGQGMTLEQAIAYMRERTPDSPVQALRDG
jgi:tetratricopeptide (TPR) repeat protein